jgi:hypothetical protein
MGHGVEVYFHHRIMWVGRFAQIWGLDKKRVQGGFFSCGATSSQAAECEARTYESSGAPPVRKTTRNMKASSTNPMTNMEYKFIAAIRLITALMATR